MVDAHSACQWCLRIQTLKPSPVNHHMPDELKQEKFQFLSSSIFGQQCPLKMYIGSNAEGISSATDCCLPNYVEQPMRGTRVICWTDRKATLLINVWQFDCLRNQGLLCSSFEYQICSCLFTKLYGANRTRGMGYMLDRPEPTLQTTLPPINDALSILEYN